MPKARIRYDDETCCYHLFNRTAGDPEALPFDDVDKDHFFRLVLRLNKLYAIDLISAVVMSNHYHIVCAAPKEKPSRGEVMRRWRAFHRKGKAEPDWNDPAVVDAWATRMRDISHLMKDLQQRFTRWYNRVHHRRGPLWTDRFKSVILEAGRAVWECVHYVELNPVRAKLTKTPGAYRFSTWGRYISGGRHPFAESAARHLRVHLLERTFGRQGADMDAAAVLAEMDKHMASTVQHETREHTGFVITAARRVRYWSGGAIIGSKAFVREMAAHHWGKERAGHRRLAPAREGDRPRKPSGLYSWRTLGS